MKFVSEVCNKPFCTEKIVWIQKSYSLYWIQIFILGSCILRLFLNTRMILTLLCPCFSEVSVFKRNSKFWFEPWPTVFLDFRILSKEAKSEPKVFVAQMVRGLHRRYRSFFSLLQIVILGWLVNRSVSLKKKSKIAPSTTTPFKDTHAAEPQSLIRSLFVCIFSQELRFE